MPYTVVTAGISKSFGARQALDQIDLEVGAGSVLALLGPNGAGKTTLVRILATLVRPDAGTATIAGHDLHTDPIAVKRSISLTGQFAAIDDVLTGEENLVMMSQLRHLPRRSVGPRVEELLGEFELADARHRRAGTYSGGMRRRLDLAISMISRPPVMFLDEPTSGLDPRSREQLWGTVRGLVEQDVTILLTTQYLEEADQLADKITVLDHGHVVARGTPRELKAGIGSEVLRLTFADAGTYARALACLATAERPQDRLRTLDIAIDGSARDVLTVLRRLDDVGAPALTVSTHSPSLDEVFLALTAAEHGSSEFTR